MNTVQSKAATVEKYLAELPAERRVAIAAIRKVILDNLPKGYEETMVYGMMGYVVPHSIYAAGYHCDPSHRCLTRAWPRKRTTCHCICPAYIAM